MSFVGSHVHRAGPTVSELDRLNAEVEAKDSEIATLRAEIGRADDRDRIWTEIDDEKNGHILDLEAQLALATAICEAFHSWIRDHGPTFGADSDRWQAIFAALDAWRASRTPTKGES